MVVWISGGKLFHNLGAVTTNECSSHYLHQGPADNEQLKAQIKTEESGH